MTVGHRRYGAAMGTSIGAAPFTRADALAAGFSAGVIRARIRDGDWVSLRRGVYIERSVLAEVANASDRQHALDVAAVLCTVRHDALACGSSAARILGLETLSALPDDVVIVTSGDGWGQRRRRHVLRYADVPPHHRASRHGVPTTSAARTIVDLARGWPLADGVVLADSALRGRLTTVTELHDVAVECYFWPGISKVRRALGLADPASESVLESLSRIAMYEQQLPAPRTQVVIGDAAGPIARADFLWERYGVVGEADGLGKYVSDGRRSTAAIVRAEKWREERILDAGYEIVRWGWRDANRPDVLANRLRAAFARGVARQAGRAS